MNQAASNKVVSIQYLRAFAAMMVVVQHANSGPMHLAFIGPQFATFGVDLFFVISGYIMWTTTALASRTPGQFWMARIIRIVPLYWAFTTLYLAIALVHPSALEHPSTDWLLIVKSYAFIPAIHPAFGTISPVYSLGWTLNYEMFFYLIFGIALLIRNRAGRLSALTLAFGALVAAGLFWQPSDPILHTYTDELLLEFLSGALIGAASERLMAWSWRIAVPLLCIAVPWLVAICAGVLSGSHFLVFGLPAVLTLAAFVALERGLQARPSRLGLLIGDASYSLYLCHPFVQRALYLVLPTTLAATNSMIGLLFIVVTSLAAIPAAIAIYKFFEQPVLATLRRATHIRAKDVSAAAKAVG